MDLASRSELATTWYHGYWFRDPVPPLALASALRFSQAALDEVVKQSRQTLSPSFAVLQSL
jgi:hypothetical protein